VASGDSGSPVFLLDASGPPQLAGINTLVIGTGEARRPRFRFGDLGAGTDLGATTVNAWLDQAAAGHTRRGRPPETGFRWMRESLITGVLLLAVVAVLRYRWRSRRH
jgi:hypothetical protein